MKHTKSRILLPAVLFMMAALFSNEGQAQIRDIAAGLADKRRQRKIEKSPATEHIIAVEKDLPALQEQIGRYKNPKEYEPKDDEDFERFSKPFNSVDKHLPLLKEKDPDWDVSEYEAQFAELKPIYTIIKSTNEKRIQAMALADKIYDWPGFDHDDYFRFGYNKKCTSLFSEFKNYNLACDCGPNHYKYYVDDMKVKELRVLLAEVAPITKYLPFSYSGVKRDRTKGLIKSYHDGYKGLVEKWIDWSEEALEKSKEHDNAFQSIGVLNYCKKMMETALAISDEKNTEVKATKDKIDERIKAIQKERLIENKITEDNMGKFYFLSSEIARKDFDESQAISQWNLGDPLYFRWFMPTTPLEMHQNLENVEMDMKSNEEAKMIHVVYVDGKKLYEGIYDGFRFSPGLYSDALTMRGRYNEEAPGVYDDLMQEILEKVSPGSHKLKIEAYMDADNADRAPEPFAQGEITLNVTASGLNKIKRNPEVCFPKTGMSNSSVTAKVKTLVREELDGQTPLSVRILSDGWSVKRNEYSGVILSRGVNVLLLFKNGNGNCEKREVWVEQKHNGGGSYSPLRIYGISGPVKIPCKCFN